VVSDSEHVSIYNDLNSFDQDGFSLLGSPAIKFTAASAIEAPQIEQIITKHDKEIAQTVFTLNRLQHRRAGLVAFGKPQSTDIPHPTHSA